MFKIKFLLVFFIYSALSYSQTWQTLPGLPPASGRYEDLWFINANTGWIVMCGSPSKIFKTTDGGASFTEQYQINGCLRSVAFNNANLGWAGTLEGTLLKTTNGGALWFDVDTLIFPRPIGVCDISVVGDSVMYGSGRWTGPTNVIKTTDAGLTYENIDMSAYTSYQVGIQFLSKNVGMVCGHSNIVTEGSVIVYTSDGGNTWSKKYKSFIQSEHIWNVNFVTPLIGYATVEKFITGPGSIIKSTDGGLTWQRYNDLPTSGVNLDPVGFATPLKGWVANHTGSGLWETVNGGLNWTFVSIGFSIHGIFILNDTLGYASGNQVYKYSGSPVGISNNNGNNSVPFRNTLKQNYPNPFNPSTEISYDLIMSTNVVIDIYDIQGKYVQRLKYAREGPGTFSVKWDAENLPSGVYYYSLRTDQGDYYGKAVLIK